MTSLRRSSRYPLDSNTKSRPFLYTLQATRMRTAQSRFYLPHTTHVGEFLPLFLRWRWSVKKRSISQVRELYNLLSWLLCLSCFVLQLPVFIRLATLTKSRPVLHHVIAYTFFALVMQDGLCRGFTLQCFIILCPLSPTRCLLPSQEGPPP